MASPAYSPTYPVHVTASLDPQLSRGLWLVKWLLIIPHYVVLAFLWLAFVVLSVAAFFAILFTGRYPRVIFDFNVGVLRWSWRVTYYAYGALATDRYPPFSLADDPDYPAHLEVEYPEHLSRGLVLVKWWLLAVPHYLVVGIFVSGGIYVARAADGDLGSVASGTPGVWDGGLIGLLALIAGIALLFTGSYPRQLYDLVLGLNRWVLRVVAYAGLMTDLYPPFRLDQGGEDPDTILPPSLPTTAAPGTVQESSASSRPGSNPIEPDALPRSVGQATASGRWGAGRVVSVVLASLVLLLSLGLLAAGTAAAVAGSTMRDKSGYLMSTTRQLSTGTYALTSPMLEVHSADVARTMPHRMFGDAKVRVTSNNGKSLFIGLAHAGDANAYLSGVRHATVSGDNGHPSYQITGSQPPAGPPAGSDIWVAHATGSGTQSLVAPVANGTWTVVVMNADGSPGVDSTISVGATVPGLGTLSAVLFAVGVPLLVVSLVVLVVALRRAANWPSSKR